MVSEGTVRPLKSATSVTHLLPPTDTYRLPVAIDRFSGFLTKLATRPPLSWFRLPTLIPLLGPPNLHNPNRLFPVAVPIPGLVRFMDLGNPFAVVVHYLYIGRMTCLGHLDKVPSMSALVCMVTQWK
uniref:Uncharacterized protein n=1 Tax=Vitis vinifera TaxID=29760 RepID=A5B6X2_VITVI|nr:hypothetical protein VITISV_023289 [Vitis vinifera]